MEPDYLTAATKAGGVDPGAWGAHDPTVVRARDGRYLLFSTDTAVAGAPGVGVQIRQSTDLVAWHWFGHAFDGVPDEAAHRAGAAGIWAPEVVRRGEEFRMYYSASSFGSRTSVIALATAPDATGPWSHREVVVATTHEDSQVNAIDAAVVVDGAGDDWLLYGSFFGGLRILPLGDDGRPLRPGDHGSEVVKRARSLNGAVEGGHVLFDPQTSSYNLFCSFDSLFDTYNVRVARAPGVDGPYLDAAGRTLVDDSEPPSGAGTLVLAGYEAPNGTLWSAPGHSSHLVTEAGCFLVHHVRDGHEPTRHTAHVRRIEWTRGGWPLVSPLLFSGTTTDVPAVLGDRWLVYVLDPEAPVPLRPRPLDVLPEQFVDLERDGRGVLVLDGRTLDAVLFVEADDVAVAGIDEQGVVVWAVRA